MKQAQPADAAAIATLLVNEQIQGSSINEFGTTETNDADSPDVLPVYTPISLGQTVLVRSTNEFGTYNKLSNSRFLSMTLAVQMRFVSRFPRPAGATGHRDFRREPGSVPRTSDPQTKTSR